MNSKITEKQDCDKIQEIKAERAKSMSDIADLLIDENLEAFKSLANDTANNTNI